MRAILPASLLAVAFLAGCASEDSSNAIRDVYGDDVRSITDILPPGAEVPENVTRILVIVGQHLEGRVGNGTWGSNLVVKTSKDVAGPRMGAPAPLGGGGDTTELTVDPVQLEVRIPEGDRLGDLRVAWLVASGSTAPISAFTMRSPTETFTASAGFGLTQVVAALYDGEPSPDNLPLAVYQEPLQATVQASFTITGQVQAVKPPAPVPATGARDAMVDKYTIDLPEGTQVAATSVFDGTFLPTSGGDVDLGLYDPGGAGTVCSATGGGQLPVAGGGNPLPSAAQADEMVNATTTEDGTWSVQIGAMLDGCPDVAGTATTYFYVNLGPVPYRLTITIG